MKTQLRLFVKRISNIMKVLVYANVFIAIAAVSSYYLFSQLQQQISHINQLCVVFLGTFLSYNLCIFTLHPRSKSPKFRFLWQYQVPLKVVWWLAAVFLLYFLSQLPTSELLYLLHLSAIAFFYSIPLPQKALRNIPYLKIFLVAYVWASVTVFFPSLQFSTSSWVLFCGQFLFVTAITLPFDLRDIHTDHAQGLRTIAQGIGTRPTIYIALACLLGATLCFGYLGSWAVALHNLWAMCVVLRAKPQRHELYFTGLIDSLLISQSIIGVLALDEQATFG
jgi:hypothetical protein